jgi:hypothetical protein
MFENVDYFTDMLKKISFSQATSEEQIPTNF